jgi:hypothetical protein
MEERSAIDVFAEAEAIADGLGPRPPGSDAERRAAKRMAERLRELGREVEVEPFPVWPRWALAAAIHAGLGILGSVLSVTWAAIGTALVFAAAALTFLDLSGVLPSTRSLLGRRASQNLVSWGERDKPAALLLVAHLDSGARGLVRGEPLLAPLLWSLLLVLACCALRLLGLAGVLLTAVQFVPTVALILAVPLYVGIALTHPHAGVNDNASGSALALRLAQRLQPASYGVHAVLTGSQKAVAEGMRSFLKRQGKQFARDATVVLNLDALGSGSVRFTTKEGPLLRLRSGKQLVDLCEEIAEDDEGSSPPEPISTREASDGYAARSAGFASITITGSDPSERLDEESLARAEAFCAELVARLDDLSG